MKTNLKVLASLVLVSALSAGHAQTASSTGTSSKTTAKKTHRKAVPKKPSVESQIEELREGLNSQKSQIDSLKQQLADRDTQLQQAQTAAQQAQAAAQQAQQAAQTQQQQLSDNSEAVTSLKTSVADLQTNTTSVVSTIQDNQAQVKKAIESPDTIHFKGITLSPTGSFIEAATVNRTRGTASDIPTAFNAIPFDAANAGNISEFYATGRQSRLALLAEGKVSNATIRGYYEVDWLGAGTTSNNNQSNSYVLRDRQLWAQAQLNSGWTFTAGQMWSLATETKQGLTNRSEVPPLTIDPNYNVGFVFTRQYGFRVVKQVGNTFWFGASIEDPQTLTPSCAAAGTGASCPTNYVIGASGTNAGLYNNTTTYSYNLAPDLIAKIAYEPKWGGHYELFGIARFFRNRIYPNAGAATPSAAGAYNDSTVGGGVGGGFRVPTFKKHLDVGLKGLYGEGTNRYGTSTLPDTTLRPDAQLALLHGFSTLGTLEWHATPRLDVYANYGADYAGRRYFAMGSGFEGYGSPNLVNTGCSTEVVPGTTTSGYTPSNPSKCAGVNKDTQEATFGWWYDFYKGPHGRLRQSLQYSYVIRNTWSGVGGAPSATNNVIETAIRYYMP